MAHLSLGSPIQLDDGSTFEDYKTRYDMPSPFPSTFSDAESSPSTQTSSVPSSSFLGYTPPTSDEETDKDADGDFYTYSGPSSPIESFPTIVSPIPLPSASTLLAWDSATNIHHGTQSSQESSKCNYDSSFNNDNSFMFSHAPLDNLHSTLVAGSYLDPESCLSTPGGLMAPLYHSDLSKLELPTSDASRRDSDATNLSFGSYGTFSDASDSAGPAASTMTAPLPTCDSGSSGTPLPTSNGIDNTGDSYTVGTEQQQQSAYDHAVSTSSEIPSYSGYFPQSAQCHSCSFADCAWLTDNEDMLRDHHENHVRSGVFNCPLATCLKHFTTFTNLEAHRLLEHAFTDLPLAPHTSFASAMLPEADQYFPPMPSCTTDGPSEAPTPMFHPYYSVAQSANDTVGLGFISNESTNNQSQSQMQTVGPVDTLPSDSVLGAYASQGNPTLPRRASESNIHTNHNGHVSSVSWEATMPSLLENEIYCVTPEQQITNLPSAPVSACSSVLSTPQQSLQRQQRFAFNLAMAAPESVTSDEASLLGTSAPMVHSGSAPGLQQNFTQLHHADVHGMSARFQAANAAYREGIYGPPPTMHSQMNQVGSGIYYSNLHDGSATYLTGHAPTYFTGHAPNGLEGYAYLAQAYPAPQYVTQQHVNLASIDPTMAMPSAYVATPDYSASSYPPTLVNHIVHQRVARNALPRRGSESSYLANHATASHPYAIALSAALASNSKKVTLPDSVGPARNKPTKVRINLPGPKGQEIPKASRKSSGADHLTLGGFVPEEVEGINLAELKLHPCDFEGCCRVFKRLEHKRRHQRSHTQEKPYQCPVEGCKRFFSRSDNLTQHRRTHERNGRTQRLTLANLQQCAPYGNGNGALSYDQPNQVHAA